MADVQVIYPDYYPEFECIKGECKHNCCIGWEIDIDPASLDYYLNVKGEFGERLKKSISYDGTPHFNLSANERCPFLNDGNLCDIIIELGENHICDICTEHPRFNNQLPDRIEKGLGLTCEAAGRIILSKKDPVKFIGSFESNDEIIKLRDKIVSVLQDRSKTIAERITTMLELCNTSIPERDFGYWIDALLSLERLDESWTDILNELKNTNPDVHVFDVYMINRQNEYEQLLVYFIYRHFANAFDLDDAAARACFAVLGYEIIHRIGAMIYSQNLSFCFEDQVEIVRMFSSEVEYSQDNLDTLFDEMI
ncbi:MAG: flagellin lysine-N-methylase [Clostridia bacterium]|nr:flagellin lysine-N-methylase [Clostridia bacterium]